MISDCQTHIFEFFENNFLLLNRAGIKIRMVVLHDWNVWIEIQSVEFNCTVDSVAFLFFV